MYIMKSTFSVSENETPVMQCTDIAILLGSCPLS